MSFRGRPSTLSAVRGGMNFGLLGQPIQRLGEQVLSGGDDGLEHGGNLAGESLGVAANLPVACGQFQ